MDPWLNEYERLNQQASEISADIKDVNAQVHKKKKEKGRERAVNKDNRTRVRE